MDASTEIKLLQLNRQFYQTFSTQFSATRGRVQPGVRRLLGQLQGVERIVDLGCGNGSVARALAQLDFRGSYLGLDFSPALLNGAAGLPAAFSFSAVVLSEPGWEAGLEPGSFDLALCFAVLHHIPGQGRRQALLQALRTRLAGSGRLALSTWQFLSSARLSARIQPWSAAGLDPGQVDPGDHLLDWRAGGTGLRYVHAFTPEELERLADCSGWRVREQFFSDGENGRLGLYQVWEMA